MSEQNWVGFTFEQRSHLQAAAYSIQTIAPPSNEEWIRDVHSHREMAAFVKEAAKTLQQCGTRGDVEERTFTRL